MKKSASIAMILLASAALLSAHTFTDANGCETNVENTQEIETQNPIETEGEVNELDNVLDMDVTDETSGIASESVEDSGTIWLIDETEPNMETEEKVEKTENENVKEEMEEELTEELKKEELKIDSEKTQDNEEIVEPAEDLGEKDNQTSENNEPIEDQEDNIRKVTGPKKTYMTGVREIPDMEWRGMQRLCQQDDAWASEPYGVITVAQGGCGLVSLSRAITYQYKEEILPTDLIDMKSQKDGGLSYRKANVRGTDSSLYPEWAAQFGLECRRTNNPNIAVYEMLNRGAVSVSKMTSEPLGPGHYVFFAEWLRDQEKVVIMDPTIENLIVQPDGIYNQNVMFRACGEYALIYPKGAIGIPDQDVFQKRQSEVWHDIKYYDKIENGWTEEEQ